MTQPERTLVTFIAHQQRLAQHLTEMAELVDEMAQRMDVDQDATRQQLLDELSGGKRPCIWCLGVPVFDNADDLLAHVHDRHPPLEA